MTRGRQVKSALLMLLFALVASSIMVTSAAVMLGMAGRPVSGEAVLAATIVLAGAIILLRDLIARALIGLILGWRVKRVENDEGSEESSGLDLEYVKMAFDEELEDIEDPESLEVEMARESEKHAAIFIIWNLIERMRSKIAPWTKASIIVFHEGGIPYDAYPDDLVASLAIDDASAEPETGKEIAAVASGSVIEVWLDTKIVKILSREALQGEDAGEIFRVRSVDTANILYLIAKEIYKALNPGAPEELAAYIAYKTLLQLEKENIIKLEEKPSISKIERSDIWASIRRQIEEEESLKQERQQSGKGLNR